MKSESWNRKTTSAEFYLAFFYGTRDDWTRKSKTGAVGTSSYSDVIHRDSHRWSKPQQSIRKTLTACKRSKLRFEMQTISRLYIGIRVAQPLLIYLTRHEHLRTNFHKQYSCSFHLSVKLYPFLHELFPNYF